MLEYTLDFGICPDCGSKFVFDRDDPAWTESRDLVVITLICLRCDYSECAHIRLTPVAGDGAGGHTGDVEGETRPAPEHDG